MSPIAKEKYEMQCAEITQLVERFLPMESWGFKESARFAQRSLFPTIIYDSEWCRVRFMWDGIVGPLDQVKMYIDYGRLHAPNNENSQDWSITTINGDKCYCWHSVNEALNFLDGLSPQDAVEQISVHGQWPRVMEMVKESEVGKSLMYAQPEWIIRMHAAAWEEYEQRLFELFDLHRPELWNQYIEFVREYYRIRGVGIIPLDPPQYKIC